MTTRIRWTAALWVGLGLLASTAPAAMAQSGGGTLPAYGEPTIISTPGQLGVHAADFNRDNIPDIATFSMTGLVTVYPGLGDGQFGSGIPSSGGMNGLLGFGDFNGDGTPDIAVRGPEDVMGCSSEMGVMFGNGNGAFQTYRAVGTLPWETNPAVGDFDGDGRSDLAGAGLYHCGESDVKLGIVFLWGRADANFDRTELETDLGPTRINHALFTADFTGDGKPDLVWKKYPQGKFVVMPGLGSRTFGAPIDHTSAGEPTRFAAADFNADGKQDLAVLYPGGIGILYGNGDGSFQPVISPGPWTQNPNGPSRLLVRDFNGDAKPDLSIDAVEGVALFVNNGDGTFRRYALTAGVAVPHNHYSFADYDVADLNADGRTDFVAGWAGEGGCLPREVGILHRALRVQCRVHGRAGGLADGHGHAGRPHRPDHLLRWRQRAGQCGTDWRPGGLRHDHAEAGPARVPGDVWRHADERVRRALEPGRSHGQRGACPRVADIAGREPRVPSARAGFSRLRPERQSRPPGG